MGEVDVLSQDPEGGWEVAGHPVANLLRRYEAQCAQSQQIFADHEFDELGAYAPPGLELVSLRWIATHLMEEAGRHLGHLDLLREMVDGSRAVLGLRPTQPSPCGIAGCFVRGSYRTRTPRMTTAAGRASSSGSDRGSVQ